MIGDYLVRNIALIGFMGSGKTSVGRELARRVGFVFCDLDERIESAEGMSVSEIFASRGEGSFRERERAIFSELCAGEGQVIACGGGTFLDPRNREVARPHCLTIWLRAPAEEIVKRVTRPSAPKRPLLEGADPAEVIPVLLRAREGTYEGADLVVETQGRSVGDVAEEIRTALGLPLIGGGGA
jgi:shikimate kinase